MDIMSGGASGAEELAEELAELAELGYGLV
jgi:hypothetical protein